MSTGVWLIDWQHHTVRFQVANASQYHSSLCHYICLSYAWKPESVGADNWHFFCLSDLIYWIIIGFVFQVPLCFPFSAPSKPRIEITNGRMEQFYGKQNAQLRANLLAVSNHLSRWIGGELDICVFIFLYPMNWVKTSLSLPIKE